MYQLNNKKVFADISDDMAIIINSESGVYYGINSFGASVFEYLLKGVSTTALLDIICKIQGVPVDMAQRLDVFVEALKAKEILIASETVDMEIFINPKLAVEYNFELELHEYIDAQELLLADPIHDVDDNIGWQPNIVPVCNTDEEPDWQPLLNDKE